MAIDELKTARDELLLLITTLDTHAADQARSILGRIERALDHLRDPGRAHE